MFMSRQLVIRYRTFRPLGPVWSAAREGTPPGIQRQQADVVLTGAQRTEDAWESVQL